ncbi:ABC transporter permease [Streptomyces coffeae]|uniref:FtsX-like permease family protein n=1 Tax=Streptomyces coffeae TaxID=621382 RepID=A0ABS1NCS5_9ACTN|nr:FtsX family ABC transporter permease [Streptomyces coffeae]MBL1097879.1 FtsX-like permease family protein [Streptomyces coffeae]
MLRTTLRTLRSHRLRFALPALAVVLGVAFVTGSLIYGDSVSAALAKARANSQPDVSVAVRPAESTQYSTSDSPDAAPRLDQALLKRLRALPGAAAARGTVEGPSFLAGSDGGLVGDLYRSAGVNYVPGPGGKDPRYPLTAGRGPRASGEIAIDKAAAERSGTRVGGTVRIVVNGTARDARVVGLFTAEDSRLASGGTLTAFDNTTALRQFAPDQGGYTTITLTADEGTSQAQLAEHAQDVLPRGLEAVTADQLRGEATAASDAKLTTVLLGFAGVALFVSTFLVANTFTMLSAARAREHALLRAVGATRRYVMRQVLTEAGVVGAVASVVGYAAGIGVAALLSTLFGDTGGVVDVPLRILQPTPVLAAFGVGVAVTMLAAYVPARRAASVSPVAALRTSRPPTPASLRRRGVVGVTVTGLGVLLLWAAAGDENMLYLAVPVLLVGLIVLTPLIALGVTGLLRTPLRRLAGIRGKLAVENARRNPRRTAATAATLMVGLAMVTAVTVVVASLSRVDEDEADQAMASDLRITAVDFGEIGADVAARVARLPDAAAVTAVVNTDIRISREDMLPAAAVTPSTVERLAPITLREGSLKRLDRGIALEEETAAARHLKLGSRVTGSVAGTERKTALPVVAIYEGKDFASALVSRTQLPRTADGDHARVASVLTDADPGRTAALQRDIRRTLDNPALLVQDRAEVRKAASSTSAEFLNIMYALLSITVLIGILGVVNTMGMAVSERVREIGLLRALGLDRRRLASVLRIESVTISLLGAALGLVAGAAIGVAAVLTQPSVPLVVPWDRAALCFAGTAAIGVLASLWPGRQAMAVPMLRAVGTDTE